MAAFQATVEPPFWLRNVKSNLSFSFATLLLSSRKEKEARAGYMTILTAGYHNSKDRALFQKKYNYIRTLDHLVIVFGKVISLSEIGKNVIFVFFFQ